MLIPCPSTGNIQLICTNSFIRCWNIEILCYHLLNNHCLQSSPPPPPPPRPSPSPLSWFHTLNTATHCYKVVWEPNNLPTLVLGKPASRSLLLLCQGISKEEVTLGSGTMTPSCRNLWCPFGALRLWLVVTGWHSAVLPMYPLKWTILLSNILNIVLKLE